MLDYMFFLKISKEFFYTRTYHLKVKRLCLFLKIHQTKTKTFAKYKSAIAF